MAQQAGRLKSSGGGSATPARWPIIFLVWTGIALVIATQNYIYQSALHQTFPEITTSWTDSFRYPLVECAFWAVLTPVLLRLSHHFPLFARLRAWNAVRLVAVNLGVGLLHAFYRIPFHGFVYPTMPPISYPQLLKYYMAGNVLNDVWVFWTIIGIGQLVEHYVRSVDREKDLARAQLQALAAQLQPHFLFNVLNSVSSLMREDIEAADDMITRLSNLMRTTLKSGFPHEASLKDELELVETYVQIERMRFPDRLSFTVSAEPQVLDAMVPTLTLLPIVENSVRYAVAPRSSPGHIEVRARRDHHDLVLSVADDGPGIQAGPKFREGLGLANTRMRLDRYYSGFAALNYHNLQTGGFEVTVRMPLTFRTMDDGHDTHSYRG